MCRIAGIVDYDNPPTKEEILRFRDAMQRGGPDDEGIYMDADLPLAFGHRRLSFLDLSPLGHQPMLDRSGRVVLIFNGEIYNFQNLRNELITKGYSFNSTSDTEVIINSYLEWGKDCFAKFNGIFALAIFDKRSNKLILARDHMGIKPLYYSVRGKSIVFASEVRAFKTLFSNWPENQEWKKYFLLFGHLPEPITTLEGVVPLEKSSVLEIDLGTFKQSTTRHHIINYQYTINDRSEAIREIRRSLDEAVQRNLVSDAPIGLFLSGGVDSSLLTLLASKFIPKNLHTLSIVFDDLRYSEKEFQDIIIGETKAIHKSYRVTKDDFLAALPDILKAMDQPSNDGINSYFISKYANDFGIKAALSGLGADELFGGYPSFQRVNMLRTFGLLPSFMFAAAGVFPGDRLKKIQYLRLRNGFGQYMFNRGLFTPAQVAALLNCSEREIVSLLENMQSLIPENIHTLLPQEKASYFELDWYMKNQLLKDTDYMSMWHGLEVRVPFLDKEFLNVVFAIDPAIRFENPGSKKLLIDSFNDLLPAEIWQRKKQGFSFPFNDWMKYLPQIPDFQEPSTLKRDLVSGKIHWSRYWSFLLTR